MVIMAAIKCVALCWTVRDAPSASMWFNETFSCVPYENIRYGVYVEHIVLNHFIVWLVVFVLVFSFCVLGVCLLLLIYLSSCFIGYNTLVFLEGGGVGVEFLCFFVCVFAVHLMGSEYIFGTKRKGKGEQRDIH